MVTWRWGGIEDLDGEARTRVLPLFLGVRRDREQWTKQQNYSLIICCPPGFKIVINHTKLVHRHAPSDHQADMIAVCVGACTRHRQSLLL